MYDKPDSIDKPTRENLTDEDRAALNKARDILLRLFDGFHGETYSTVGDAVLDLMALEEEPESYPIDECCSGSTYVLKRAVKYHETQCPKCKGNGKIGEMSEVE